MGGRSAPPAGAAGNRPGAASREGRKDGGGGGGERTVLFPPVPQAPGPGSKHRVGEEAGTASEDDSRIRLGAPDLRRALLGQQITACRAGQEEGAFFFFFFLI